MMWKRQLIAGAIALLCLPRVVASPADIRVFGAGFENSVWQADGDDQVCRLRHPLPTYGFAVLEQDNRGRRRLNIEAYTLVEAVEGSAQLLLLAPTWRHLDPKDERLQPVVRTGNRPLELEGRPVDWLVRGLTDGYLAALEYDTDHESGGWVRVTLSPVNFSSRYKEFRACIGQLAEPLLTAEEAGFSDIRFATDKYNLTRPAKNILDRLAAYLAQNPKITTLELDGHADSTGAEKRNQPLSENRAKAVADYLTTAGIAAERINRQHFGATKPKSDNATPAGRAMNRRVEMRFIYAEPETRDNEQETDQDSNQEEF